MNENMEMTVPGEAGAQSRPSWLHGRWIDEVAFCRELLMNIAFMRELGGGPFEAWERLITHENLMSDLSNTFGTYLIKFFDLLASGLLCFIGMVIPSFTQYDIYTNYVASGFNIPFNTLAVHGLTTLAYVGPLFVVAYLILRGREVAK